MLEISVTFKPQEEKLLGIDSYFGCTLTMDFLPVLLLIASFSFVLCQRPPYAGRHPIGYPDVETPSDPELGSSDLPFDRLPLEARGDEELVARLIKLPVDKQPFWLINWQALEWNRQHPQTYPIRPNPFLQTPVPTIN